MEWVCDIRNPQLRSGQTPETAWRAYRSDIYKLLEKVGIDTHGLAAKYERGLNQAA